MDAWGWLARRVEVLFRKQSAEEELDEEIRFHLEMETREKAREGLTPEEARRAAMVAFGGVERVKEEVRDVRGARMLDDLVQDVRLAARSLPKQPAFLVAVLLTLGIGIGGNVAMFGILDASLFQALPYPDADRLVMPRTTFEGHANSTSSGPDYFDYRQQARSFEYLGAFIAAELQGTVTGAGEPERISYSIAHADMFRALGAQPAMGRLFTPEEGELGSPGVVLLSHGYWQRRFGGATDVLGQVLTLDGTPYSVVGVMPAGFRYMVDVDLWRSMQRGGYAAQARQFHNWSLVGRLAPGVTREAAQAEVDVIAAQLREEYPVTNRTKGLLLTPLQEALAEDYRQSLMMLMGAVALLLLVACGNVAGLLLARGSTRGSEMAVRSVMGAGKGRLARQLLTENGILAIGAGVLGLGLAIWLERGILSFVSLDRLGVERAGSSVTTFGLAALVSAATMVLFGVAPALRSSSRDPAGDLRGGARLAGSLRGTRLRSSLVVGQVTVTVVLLVVSGLLVRSFLELRRVDTGFEVSRLLTAEVQLPSDKYAEAERRTAFFTRFQQRLEEIPGVEAVALISQLPIRDPWNNVDVALPTTFVTDPDQRGNAYQRTVLPGYFEAMGIPLLAGRDIAETDDAENTPVLVISESMAEEFFPGGDPLGRQLGVDVGDTEPAVFEVVGVVGDVTASMLDEWLDNTMYSSYRQRPTRTMRVAVRTREAPAGATAAVRDVLRSMDPDVPLAGVATMDDVVAGSVSDQKAIAAVLGLFAVVALLLAAVGLYGVLAYQVTQRFHEIGVRMALGSTAQAVSRSVLRRGLLLVMGGLVLGVPSAFAAGRIMKGMLFGVGTTDLPTYVGMGLFLMGVASVACVIPAWKAARIDPVEAFRTE
jgi:predicted permease